VAGEYEIGPPWFSYWIPPPCRERASSFFFSFGTSISVLPRWIADRSLGMLQRDPELFFSYTVGVPTDPVLFFSLNSAPGSTSSPPFTLMTLRAPDFLSLLSGGDLVKKWEFFLGSGEGLSCEPGAKLPLLFPPNQLAADPTQTPSCEFLWLSFR